MADWTDCLNFGISVAKQANCSVSVSAEKEVKLKSSPADLVTETDQRVEKILISAIRNKYPEHRFIGEESVAAGECLELTDCPTWIIDPIDGTVNFVHRFPFVAISIAFTVNKQTEFGIVYSCVEDKLYHAQRGRGAYLNGQPLHASGQEDVSKCVVVTEIGAERDDLALSTMTSNIFRLLKLPVHGVRALGTAAVDMCQVATGGADAYYHIGMHCWDIAASAIIVQEAGGVIMDTDGSEFDMMSRRVIAASSSSVALCIAQVIQDARADVSHSAMKMFAYADPIALLQHVPLAPSAGDEGEASIQQCELGLRSLTSGFSGVLEVTVEGDPQRQRVSDEEGVPESSWLCPRGSVSGLSGPEPVVERGRGGGGLSGPLSFSLSIVGSSSATIKASTCSRVSDRSRLPRFLFAQTVAIWKGPRHSPFESPFKVPTR
ncbi:Inositol monophosphatase 1 [Larimichthys crocea]|uniref:inositol-phosphate phosphatase n=1 Tax=Larimichthys crocea TaxID=215358 RepID=A0A6G0IGR9_LARCR|nr:Inositol monophosphatase 1 [Larimichthys crocea]